MTTEMKEIIIAAISVIVPALIAIGVLVKNIIDLKKHLIDITLKYVQLEGERKDKDEDRDEKREMRISELLMLRVERLTIRVDCLEEDNSKKIRQIQDLYNEVFELRNTISDKNMEIDRLRADNARQQLAYDEQEITIEKQGIRITELENIQKGK